MKILYSILFFSLMEQCFSQEQPSPIFHLDSLPAKGIKLDRGWKFHTGDNPLWAKSGYDDKAWKLVNPTLELHHLPLVKEAGIGWFRLKIKVDSSLLNEKFAMVLTSQGASEIYLNGELIYRFGTVSSDFGVEQTRFVSYRPFSLKLGDQQIQELAVRYSFHNKNLYVNITYTTCMQMILKENNQAFADYIRYEGFYQNLRSLKLSFYLPLGLLLLFLYFSYRLQKEYLYMGVFSFCMFLGMLLQILGLMETRTVSQANLYLLTHQVMWVFGLVVFLNGTYILFKQHKSWVYYLIVLFALLIIPAFLLFYKWGGLFASFFTPVVLIEFLRLSLKSFRRRRPGSVTLVILGILCLLLIIGTIGFDFMGRGELSGFCYSLCFLLPPIGLSLFFAGEFARTGLALQLRVVEVEQLSEKTIAQEKEKQQILFTQNETLEIQVSERTIALSKSLKELKETQTQLIQQEKMASLGELTAGIAHEIQNPLNFVNNFSEVNKELLVEMKEEIDKGNIDEVKAIANDVIENEQKINHHGQRAGDIVKGMLLHSRSSSGVKEPTNINALADEYLRLAYHGLRAKDKSFNATMKTDFDETIGNINIIPQDIGRVILNLITNAFYAVSEKKKQVGDIYETTVSVSTRKINDKVEVRVKDNGNGIPQKILDKIFQPFFTTKPTGQGTGLGLSLAYDIIKAHGGELKVETKEGEGSEFIIQLAAV